ncbi:MAG: hypothetical protein M0Z84_01625 [Gammaproteobacteria bacterium]|nr:hypothetical protein [Gammaproteobacteria bacterium]
MCDGGKVDSRRLKGIIWFGYDCQGATAIIHSADVPKDRSIVRIATDDTIAALTTDDRALLRDLAVVRFIPRDLIERFYYARPRVAARRLACLEDAGILRSRQLFVAGTRPVRIYRFAGRAGAARWGDPVPPAWTPSRMAHEVLTARAYFDLKRPLGFRVAVHIGTAQRALFESHCPDATYADGSRLILVEADSGRYTARQVREKMAYWCAVGFLWQVWVQPLHAAAARVPEGPGIRVLRL